MELRLQSKITTTTTTILLIITAFGCRILGGHAFTIRDDACSSISATSKCACYTGGEFEVECPRDDPEIVLRVEVSRAEIECNHNSNRKIYALLPDIKLSNFTRLPIDNVKFKNCPLPEGTTIKGILVDRLGINRVQTLTFSSRTDMQMRREQLSSLSSLRNLRFNGPISDLPEDAFDEVSNITTLELRSNNVHLPKKIFKSLYDLEFLELGSNNLSDLPENIFSNQRKLKRLNLWSNNLRNLTRDSFVGATSVTDLDLSSNNIEVIKSDVFHHLKDMENINLSSNRFVELPAGLFSMNKKLHKFRLMYNRVDLKTLPNALLAHLPLLEEVLIRCNIQLLPEDLFNESVNIQNISLQSNQLSTLPENMFRSQTNLLDLDLSDNQLVALPETLFNSTRKLAVLRLSHNNLEEIPESLFSGLFQLTELYLDNNRLATIHRTTFWHTNLKILNLENNRLAFVPSPLQKDPSKYSPFEFTKKLIRLNLRNNSIEHYLADWNTHNTDLEVLDLSYNKITALQLVQINASWKQAITVNLSHNYIKNIFADQLDYEIVLNETHQTIGEHPNMLWKWILNDNPIDCDCNILYFVKLVRENPSTGRYLKLITDDLKCTAPPALANQLVRDVKLHSLLCPLDSPNTNTKYCPSACDCMVRRIDETIIFNCSNAGLDRMPKLPNIIRNNRPWLAKYEVNIENNHIANLPNKNEVGYDRVTKLLARNNSIERISNENLPQNLTKLDLSRNHLKTLDERILWRLNATGMRMILAENPWNCECNTPFMKNIKTHSAKVDYTNITCDTGEFMRDKSDVCPMERTLVILACVLVALLGLFLGAVLALYYKYQQEVKVWLFAHNLCLWFVTEEELDKDKKYDAFISFSHKDEDFVTEQLVPELETGPHPFKICLHFRDWVVGEFIPNQISKSVEDSRRTIVVLTPNFIDSIWGRMEFRAAHKNALAEGRARLIVIIYGDIGDIEKLDPELKVYLKTNTYVKWGDPWFFDKLRYALPHPTNYKSKGLIKSTMKSSIDDKLELIKPQAVTPPLTTPPAEQAGQNPLIGKLNGDATAKYHTGLNGLNGHVNGAFIINTNAKQSDV